MNQAAEAPSRLKVPMLPLGPHGFSWQVLVSSDRVVCGCTPCQTQSDTAVMSQVWVQAHSQGEVLEYHTRVAMCHWSRWIHENIRDM
eukprot:1419930-Amphidinium_carterae.1